MILETAVVCMALNIHHEARGEPFKCQLAVGLTTLNRAKHNPEKVCKVVFKPYQFSWTITMPGLQNSNEFEKSIIAARMSFKSVDFTNGATHYHHVNIKPYWIKGMVPNSRFRCGQHYFYRSK